MRYLIWSVGQQDPRTGYPELIDALAARCGIKPERFRGILADRTDAAGGEIDRIKAVMAEYDAENAPYIDAEYLYAGGVEEHQAQLIHENIRYLLLSIPWGENQDLIEALQIQPSTLNRWKNGSMRPGRFFQAKICRYFGVPDPGELKTAYLFLGLSPSTAAERKAQIKRMIDSADKDEFERLYPALLKLLQ